MKAFYNDTDIYCCAWLSNLMDAGLITPGVIDDRSIEDISPDDVRGFERVHWFAGLGVWDYSLTLAGWPGGRGTTWTGSAPCQPWSVAGKGAGVDDRRHLWPAWSRLIAQCRPAVCFGEQVSSKAADVWLDLVHDNMEAMDYAFGAVAFPACSLGAPHIRQRIYWVAHSEQHNHRCETAAADHAGPQADRSANRVGGCGSVAGGMADTDGGGQHAWDGHTPTAGHRHPVAAASRVDRQRHAGPLDGFWRDADWLKCRDGKWRPAQPTIQPLVDVAACRMAKLRAIGNALVAEQAAEFIRCAM